MQSDSICLSCSLKPLLRLESNTMNIFYKHTSKNHLNYLIEERDYYLKRMNETGSKDNKEAFRLMAEYYTALIKAAEKHIKATLG